MPPANLLERRCKPGRVQGAFDLGDKAEMHRKGERIEIKESLATAERADKSRSCLSAAPIPGGLRPPNAPSLLVITILAAAADY
jgi:hypothetical protein